MCKFNVHILAILCILGAFSGILHAESTVVLRPSADALCTANPFITFSQDFTDDGYFGDSHRFMYEYSANGITWTRLAYTHKSPTWGYTQRPTNLEEGWYRVLVAREDELDKPDRWIVSEPVWMQKIEGGCNPYRFTWPDEISENVCPHGTILFREDFGGNDPSDPITSPTPLTTMSTRYRQDFDVQRTSPGSGKFIVAKYGWQNSLQPSTTDCMYSQWFIQDDHTYLNDYTRGYVLEIDGKGGNDAFYTTTFPVCHELDLSFSAYVANVLEPGHNFARPKVRFLIQDELSNDTLWEQSSGPIEPAPSDYRQYGIPTTMSAPWHLVGASFHVPAWVSSIRLSIFNDEDSGFGNDFAMDDIEIRLCKPEVDIHSEHEICMYSPYIFEASVTADGGFQQPYNYLWQYAPDSLEFNDEGWTNVVLGERLAFESVQQSNEGWYRLCVTSTDIDVETERFCRAMSEPFHLKVIDCCPEVLNGSDDIVVCDTLMPFLWHGVLFEEPSTREIMEKDMRGCDSILLVCSLDTVHCERLYPIIVNKYNWQLLCDNVALRRIFPGRTPTAFQWYKDKEPIPGATIDDYAEYNKLNGTFQLRVTLDYEEVIWSNIIEIVDSIEEIPVRVRVYNSRGEEVKESQVTHGFYLYRYEQGEHCWTQKKLIL